jgi:CysZ protein
MISAIAKALGQLPEPRMRNTVLLSILASLGLIAALAAIAWALITTTGAFSIPFISDVLAWLGAAAVTMLALLFFPGTVTVVSGLFLDRVAEAVEEKHYPDLEEVRRQNIVETVISSLGLAAVAIGLNVVVLPLYLIPGLNLIIFYGLNGYLLGREFFDMVASRRMSPGDAIAFRKANRFRVFIAGVLIAVYVTIPILNLTGPVVATAFMLHVYQRLRQRAGE